MFLGVTLKNKKSKGVYVHREVLAAFTGACPKGLHVSHLNGNKSDNQLCNLKWETPEKNRSRA